VQGASRQALAAARSVLDEVTAVPPGGHVRSDAVRAAEATAGRLAEDLFAVGAVLRAEPALRRALTDPGAPADGRVALVERLLAGRLESAGAAVVRTAVSGRWSRDLDLVLALSELGVQALLAQAEAVGALDEVEDELFRFSRILAQNAPLSLALTDVAAPESAKAALLERLLADRAHPVTVRLIRRASTEHEGGDLERRIAALSQVATTRRDRVVAVVRTAHPLDAEQAGRLQDALGRHFGRRVRLQVDVDPAVLGGAVVRVGDEVIDGSVLRRLAAARRRLLR
jgi:F-type H+-transporting ATPase subunit delta